MSCWAIAVEAANSAVIPPKRSMVVWVSGLEASKFSVRISRNIPATTIVDLCSRAETGVGPSIAAGSQG